MAYTRGETFLLWSHPNCSTAAGTLGACHRLSALTPGDSPHIPRVLGRFHCTDSGTTSVSGDFMMSPFLVSGQGRFFLFISFSSSFPGRNGMRGFLEKIGRRCAESVPSPVTATRTQPAYLGTGGHVSG